MKTRTCDVVQACINQMVDQHRLICVDLDCPFRQLIETLPGWARPGLSSNEVRDAIIAEVGMMGDARTPAMQAAYDRAVAREQGTAEAFSLMSGLKAWSATDLKKQIAGLVDMVAAEHPEVSALDVALELLTRELDAFLLFARMGHLDPPREDGKLEIAILQRKAADPIIDEKIRQTVEKWAATKEERLRPLVQTRVRPVAFSQEAGTVRIELPDHQVAEVDPANMPSLLAIVLTAIRTGTPDEVNTAVHVIRAMLGGDL